MTFACLDDRWDDHPKYLDYELEHFGLMACAIVYCNRHLTDGRLPEKAVRGFGKSGKGPKLAERLVRDGVWRKTRDGFEIVGYLDHNPSREVVIARKAKRAEAGERGGKASGQARAKAPAQANGEASASTNGKQAVNPGALSHVEPSPIRSDPLRSNREISSDLSAPLRAPTPDASPPPFTPEELEHYREVERRAKARIADASPPTPLSTVLLKNEPKRAGGTKP